MHNPRKKLSVRDLARIKPIFTEEEMKIKAELRQKSMLPTFADSKSTYTRDQKNAIVIQHAIGKVGKLGEKITKDEAENIVGFEISSKTWKVVKGMGIVK